MNVHYGFQQTLRVLDFDDLSILAVSDLNSLRSSTDLLMQDLEDQQVWRTSIGLDLADRTVLEAEVLIWRILRQKSATLMRQSLNVVGRDFT
jgi:hypothetical protein